MIGLFGLYRADPEAPAELGPLARRHRSGYAIAAPAGRGAALGRAAHKQDAARGLASTSGIRVVTVGDLYNREALAPCDGVDAYDPAPAILHLYRTGALDRLADANGHFSAAIYDAPEHRLTLITDRHALHPLHVWHRERDIVFGTMIYTMLGDERIARKADRAALAQLFTMQRTVGRFTSVAGIEALPAACIWSIDRNGVRERRYWQLAWRAPDFDRERCSAALGQALRAAVQRAINGGHAGLLLSGGVDSRWILGVAPKGALACWTTASFAENPELRLAQSVARLCDAEHHAAVAAPGDTLAVHDATVIESNGLYPASPQFSVFLPAAAASCQTLLTGHGLDYTLRGYYLPSRFLELGGSRTRLPALRPIPARPSGADVLYNLRQGPPRATIERIVTPGAHAEWWKSQEDAMQSVLAPWLESDEPYNAWDAFILHAVSKHYAFTGMMSVRAVANLRMPAFDAEVMNVYLRMPPSWRCAGRPVQLALRALSPELARMPNANTHFRADLHPWLEVAALVLRGGLRRIGLAARPEVPSAMHSPGSWQDVHGLYRRDPGHRARFAQIRANLDALNFGLFDLDQLRACIDEHLDGRAKHTKLLRQLLTHEAWVRLFGIAGHA
jgi:asparagine synthetase B (glutamine-hydrolysing)